MTRYRAVKTGFIKLAMLTAVTAAVLFAAAAAEADVVATPPPGAWINLSLARERVDLRV